MSRDHQYDFVCRSDGVTYYIGCVKVFTWRVDSVESIAEVFSNWCDDDGFPHDTIIRLREHIENLRAAPRLGRVLPE